MKRREVELKLKDIGFQFKRNGRSHYIWSNGKTTVCVPRGSEIKEELFKWLLCKANGAKPAHGK